MLKNDKIYLTQEGYDQYVADIEALHEKLGSSSKDKSESYRAAVGDGWHDNFAFESAKREELMILKELEEKIAGLARIVIVEGMEDAMLIGVKDVLRLTIQNMSGRTFEQIIQLVGEDRFETKDNIKEVSINSPLGKAVYGKNVGDEVEYTVGQNKMRAKIEERISDKAIDNFNENDNAVKRLK